jgi:hypothetical protein
MLGKLGAKYWKQDVEEAKTHSNAVLHCLRDELEEVQREREEADYNNHQCRTTDGE